MRTKIVMLVISLFILSSCSKKEEQKYGNENSKPQAERISFSGNTSIILDVNGSLTANEIPDFSWYNEKNKKINLSSYRGKIIILNFWATWCGPCKKEIPDLVSIYNKYKSQGVEVLGISLDSELSVEEIGQFVGENDINYQIIQDNGMLQSAYGEIKAIPTTYIIGRDFKVKNHFVGGLNEDQLEKLIKTEL